jgi:hypothetical protein
MSNSAARRVAGSCRLPCRRKRANSRTLAGAPSSTKDSEFISNKRTARRSKRSNPRSWFDRYDATRAMTQANTVRHEPLKPSRLRHRRKLFADNGLLQRLTLLSQMTQNRGPFRTRRLRRAFRRFGDPRPATCGLRDRVASVLGCCWHWTCALCLQSGPVSSVDSSQPGKYWARAIADHAETIEGATACPTTREIAPSNSVRNRRGMPEERTSVGRLSSQEQ